MWKRCMFTFDLTWTWHVTLILKYLGRARCVSTRRFERRLFRLATTLNFGNNLGGGEVTSPLPVKPSIACDWDVNHCWVVGRGPGKDYLTIQRRVQLHSSGAVSLIVLSYNWFLIKSLDFTDWKAIPLWYWILQYPIKILISFNVTVEKHFPYLQNVTKCAE